MDTSGGEPNPHDFNQQALGAFCPQTPFRSAWSDYWYYYINDPDAGFFKIAFMTFISDQTDPTRQSAYLHVAFFPLGGGMREFDYFSDEVRSEAVAGGPPYAFRFEVPGMAEMTESGLSLTLPDVTITASFAPRHEHYFNGSNPAASPFTGEPGTPPAPQSHWFVFTLGTETQYSYSDSSLDRSGSGLTYIERGWSSSAAPGFTYLVAVDRDVKLMLVEAGHDPAPGAELWAGRLLLGDHAFTLLPNEGNHRATSAIQSCEGRVAVTIGQGDYEIALTSQASLDDFYDQGTPSQTVFDAEYPVMKTMNAKLDIELSQHGKPIAAFALPQSILEFAGGRYCEGWQSLGSGLADLEA